MSRRGTNAPKNPTPPEDPSIQIVNTLRSGVVWANELGKILNTTEAGEWDQRKMVIAALTYAAATANETTLDEEAWLDMAVMAYRGVVIE